MEDFNSLQNEVAYTYAVVENIDDQRKNYLNSYNQNMAYYEQLMSRSQDGNPDAYQMANYYYDLAMNDYSEYEGTLEQLKVYISEFETYRDRFNNLADEYKAVLRIAKVSSKYAVGERNKLIEDTNNMISQCVKGAQTCEKIAQYLITVTGSGTQKDYGSRHR